jgi:hypothetical protein
LVENRNLTPVFKTGKNGLTDKHPTLTIRAHLTDCGFCGGIATDRIAGVAYRLQNLRRWSRQAAG